VGEGCTRSFVQQYLNNNQYQGKDVWTQFHPYRFVFLCGCSTAKGNWPQAFGIPKVEGLVNNDFFKRGLRPRAFMGWKHVKWVTAFATGEGSAAYFNDDLAYWVTTFYQAWYHVSSSTGQFDTNLAAAIAAAATRPPGVPGAGTSNPAQNGIVLYGSKNMMPYNW
jgi:hypothetical protein